MSWNSRAHFSYGKHYVVFCSAAPPWLKVLKIGIFRASFFGCVTWAVFSFFYLCSVVPRKVFGKAELRPFFQFALSRPLPLRLLDNNHIKSNLRQKVPLFSARKYISIDSGMTRKKISQQKWDGLRNWEFEILTLEPPWAILIYVPPLLSFTAPILSPVIWF